MAAVMLIGLHDVAQAWPRGAHPLFRPGRRHAAGDYRDICTPPPSNRREPLANCSKSFFDTLKAEIVRQRENPDRKCHARDRSFPVHIQYVYGQRIGVASVSDAAENRAKALLAAILEQEAADDLQDYLKRGRRFEHAETAALGDCWTEATRLFLRNRGGSNPRKMNDAAAELSLRGLTPPWARVQTELSVVRAEIDRDKDDPEVRASIRSWLGASLCRRDDFH
jgi:hypothetical protein